MGLKTILLTGASGRIGRVLRQSLRDEYRLILFNRSPIQDLASNEIFIRGDIANEQEIEKAAEKADVIVDMAAVADVANFRDKLLRTNILGTYNIFEAARKNSVSRLIYASTHHTVGYYPAGQKINEKAMYFPDSMYGVTKCFAEATGRFYSQKAGLSVVCLRIGFFGERPLNERHLAVWISRRDMIHLTRCAIEAADIKFEIVYGVSNNTRNWWDISNARKVLGYQPQDDAEEFAAQLLKHPAEQWLTRVKYHGGEKTGLPFMP